MVRLNIYGIHIPLLYLTILLILWWRGNTSAFEITNWVIWINFVSCIVIVILLNWDGTLFVSRPDWSLAKPLLRFGSQSLIGSIPEYLNARLDQLILTAVVNPAALGLYAVSVTWSLTLGAMLSPLATLMFPRIAGAYTEEGAQAKFAQSVRATIILTSGFGTLLLAITPFSMRLLLGHQFEPAIPTAMVLVLASMIWQVNTIMKWGLRGLGKPFGTAWGEGIGLVITVVLLYLLLPSYGIMGAAFASLIAYCASLIALTSFTLSSSNLSLHDIFLPRRQDFFAIATVVTEALHSINNAVTRSGQTVLNQSERRDE